MEATFAGRVLQVKVGDNIRELRDALQDGKVSEDLVCDVFEVAELVQRQTTLADMSEELQRIGDRRSHAHDHGEAFMSVEDMVQPKQLCSELSYQALDVARPPATLSAAGGRVQRID